MKRSEMVKKIKEAVPYSLLTDTEIRWILDAAEKNGMLPPVNTCKLVPDPLRPGMTKHSASEREWDTE